LGEAQRGRTGSTSARVADRIEARFDDFLEAEVADTGRAYGRSRILELPRGTVNFRIFVDLMKAKTHRGIAAATACRRVRNMLLLDQASSIAACSKSRGRCAAKRS
jgi:hypothetical protein